MVLPPNGRIAQFRVDETRKPWHNGRVALPGLIRVTTLARVLGVWRGTARAWCDDLRVPIIRRPQATAIRRNGPCYVTLEGATKVLDVMLPKVMDARARRRAREALAREAAVLGTSGPGITYRDGGGPPGKAPAQTSPSSPPTKIS